VSLHWASLANMLPIAEKGCLHVVRMEAKTAAKPAQN